MTPEELKRRTKSFALRVIKLVDALPRDLAGQVIGRQLLRSATSIGANYRAACRAQSRADFAAKLSIVVEEADETLYWLELLRESGLAKPGRLTELLNEAGELLAIAIASRKTAKVASGKAANRRSEGAGDRQIRNGSAPSGTEIHSHAEAIVNRQSSIVDSSGDAAGGAETEFRREAIVNRQSSIVNSSGDAAGTVETQFRREAIVNRQSSIVNSSGPWRH
jgi:four helix bundle protein